MIKCTKGNFEASGSIPMLMTEFTIITKGMFDVLKKDGVKEEEAKKWIEANVKSAFKTEDEIEAEAKEAKKAILKFFDELFEIAE